MTQGLDIAGLEAFYVQPSATSLFKAAHKIIPEYQAWIMATQFCILVQWATKTQMATRAMMTARPCNYDFCSRICGATRAKRPSPTQRGGDHSGGAMQPMRAAILRSGLWGSHTESELPSMGDILRAQTADESSEAQIEASTYDQSWQARANKTLC